MKRVAIGIAAALVACLAYVLIVILRSGLSAHDEPTRVEALVARTVRHYAVPARLRNAANPVALSTAALAEGRAHFADHCAGCHGNDGRGEALGKQMYPKAPDMTLAATQSLSDGELFAIIENGVRLTGMPGFGDGSAQSATSSWKLVHFIRHLPKMTPQEIAAMEKLNPKSPEEWRAMEAEDAFLAGKN